jgi:hypothetical protein
LIAGFGLSVDWTPCDWDVIDQLNERGTADPTCQAALDTINAAIQEHHTTLRHLMFSCVKEHKRSFALLRRRNGISDSSGTRGRYTAAGLTTMKASGTVDTSTSASDAVA